MDVLGNWVDDNLGNILGVAGLVTGAIFYWLSLRPKRFGWQVMSRTPILSPSSGNLPLKVVYNGAEVSSPQISIVRLGNIGKVAIKADDFDGPVTISFDQSKILEVYRSGISSEKVNPSVTKDMSSKSISFTPALLNRGEWIEFRLVTDGPFEEPKVDARVADQDPSSILDQSTRATRRQTLGMLLLLGGMTSSLIAAVWSAPPWVIGTTFVSTILGIIISNRANASVWKKARKVKKRRRRNNA